MVLSARRSARHYLKKPAIFKKEHLLVDDGFHSELGAGKGCSHKPCTNLRSGTIQVHTFTEFTVPRKPLPPVCPTQCCRAEATSGGIVCPHASAASQTLSSHMAVQLRTSHLSSSRSSCGPVTRLLRGTRLILLPLLCCFLDWEYHEEGLASVCGTSR